MPRGERSSPPRSGDVVWLGAAASVQFTGERAIAFRVIRIHDWDTYDGWVWLDGYELNRAGDAVERRSVFVQAAGLRRWVPAAPGQPGRGNAGGNARRTPPSGNRAPHRRPPAD